MSTQPRRDSGPPPAGSSGSEPDAGPWVPMRPDAGQGTPGDPPPELEGEACAIDTNKLFALAAHDRQPVPSQIGVDVIESRFGAVFIAAGEACLDAVYLASLQGASGIGEPEVEVVSDECTTVAHAAVAWAEDRWLVAVIDARMDHYDLWVQPYDGGASELAAYRITDSLLRESDAVIAGVSGEDTSTGEQTRAAVVAWVEKDPSTSVSTLNARPLSPEGEPAGETVVLEESDTWSFTSLSMMQIGQSSAALAYRRVDTAGHSEIVLDVLEAETAERTRESWVLTAEAGPFGSVELATDRNGGGVIYSLGQGESSQIWFQALDASGQAARVQSGSQTGGRASPRRVVAPPENAIDASMAKLPVGYAVAYRALPGLLLDSPRIRVQFLDRNGGLIGASDVALASEFGGRTAIESAYDGRIVLGWSDLSEEGMTTVTVAKLPCVGG